MPTSSEFSQLTNGEKRSRIEEAKRFLKLLFSPEIYEELATDFQAKADAERAAKQAATPLTPECSHAAGTSESSA